MNNKKTCILALYLHISNIITITTLSFGNHLPEDGHCRPKHVQIMSYIYKLVYIYRYAVVGTDL